MLALPVLSQPVFLLNGFQTPPCETVTVESSFNQLPERLRALGREVHFFNNCSVPASPGNTRPTMEEMATALGQRIAALNAPQVDVVAASLGGLILRTYLAGRQSGQGGFSPPVNHKIRKAVFLGTPHFGPAFASLLLAGAPADNQVRQIVPGSQFMVDLATWNQGGDDLRGIDAIAVIGNAGGGTDGLISIPSASLSFTTPPERTRVVPYCHTDSAGLALFASGCGRPPYLAKVDSDEHLTWRVIRSFLTGTEEWRTLGTPLVADSIGSTRGGLVVVPRDKDDNPLPNVSAVTAGITALQRVSTYFYAEQLPVGAQNLSVAVPGGPVTAPQSITGGLFSLAILKPGPVAAAVLPAAGRVASRTLAPGMFVSLYGSVLAESSTAAVSLPLPASLSGTEVLAGTRPIGLQFAGPTQINAILPEDATGLLTLTVKSAAGASRVNVLIEPAVPAIFTQAGTGSGPASALNAISGMVITAQSKARAGDAISLYLTGLGATELRDGLQWAKLIPKVFVGGQEAQVLYAGRAPGYAGLDQINFVVPTGVTGSDTTSLRVESSGRVSNLVTLPTL